MKISVVCHGNIARSQVLHHYLDKFAKEADLNLEVFSCGTAAADAYPNVEELLADVRRELRRRGLSGAVKRDILDDVSMQRLADSDLILAADMDRKKELIARLGDQVKPCRIMLFYEFIGEGETDFSDTYDHDKGEQDTDRFARCFDELQRIAGLVVEKLGANWDFPVRAGGWFIMADNLNWGVNTK